MKLVKVLSSGIVCLLLAGCIAQSPRISYKNNELALNGLESVRTKFFFSLDNPNALPLSGAINYSLYVEDKEFLSGQSEQINAPANGETVFALQQDIAFSKIFGSAGDLINAIAKGQKSINVRLSGQYRTTVLGFIELPVKVDQAIDVPLPSMQDIEKELGNQLQEQLKNGLNLNELGKIFN